MSSSSMNSYSTYIRIEVEEFDNAICVFVEDFNQICISGEVAVDAGDIDELMKKLNDAVKEIKKGLG